jgi:hypothetical protein
VDYDCGVPFGDVLLLRLPTPLSHHTGHHRECPVFSCYLASLFSCFCSKQAPPSTVGSRLNIQLPQTADEWLELALTPAQVAQFDQGGFLGNIEILTEEECDILCDELEMVLKPTHRGREHWCVVLALLNISCHLAATPVH